eukprot:scaffold1300_cov317-Prasinococcus_capsulatus_cf.AAC.2
MCAAALLPPGYLQSLFTSSIAALQTGIMVFMDTSVLPCVSSTTYIATVISINTPRPRAASLARVGGSHSAYLGIDMVERTVHIQARTLFGARDLLAQPEVALLTLLLLAELPADRGHCQATTAQHHVRLERTVHTSQTKSVTAERPSHRSKALSCRATVGPKRTTWHSAGGRTTNCWPLSRRRLAS